MGTFLWLRLHSERCFHFRLTNYLTKELMGMERTYVDIEGELELLTTLSRKRKCTGEFSVEESPLSVVVNPKLEKHLFTPKDD